MSLVLIWLVSVVEVASTPVREDKWEKKRRWSSGINPDVLTKRLTWWRSNWGWACPPLFTNSLKAPAIQSKLIQFKLIYSKNIQIPVFSLPINPTSLPVPLPEGVGIPELEPELGPLKFAAKLVKIGQNWSKLVKKKKFQYWIRIDFFFGCPDVYLRGIPGLLPVILRLLILRRCLIRKSRRRRSTRGGRRSAARGVQRWGPWLRARAPDPGWNWRSILMNYCQHQKTCPNFQDFSLFN